MHVTTWRIFLVVFQVFCAKVVGATSSKGFLLCIERSGIWASRAALCLLHISCVVKAKFHYTSWFGAGSKLVRSKIPLRYLVRTSFEPCPNQLRTSSEPASVMEFGFTCQYKYTGVAQNIQQNAIVSLPQVSSAADWPVQSAASRLCVVHNDGRSVWWTGDGRRSN